MISLIERNIKLYRSLEEYTDDLSLQALRSDRSVKLENLSRAFVFYVIVLALLLIWFITEWYLPKAKKFLDIVYFKIRLAAIKQFEKMRKKISRFSLKHLLQNFLENLFRKETKNQNSTIRESTETVKWDSHKELFDTSINFLYLFVILKRNKQVFNVWSIQTKLKLHQFSHSEDNANEDVSLS